MLICFNNLQIINIVSVKIIKIIVRHDDIPLDFKQVSDKYNFIFSLFLIIKINEFPVLVK